MRASSQNIAKTGLGDKPLFRRSPIGELVYRPSLNHKRSVSFISVRRWRQSSRKADLELFKRAKAEGNAAIVLSIAAEISELLDGLLHCKGQRGYWVTAPPRGASFYRGAHFASEIAREVAALLKLPYHQAFKPRRPGGRRSSHPATYKTRGRLVLEPDLPGGLCLLVDDLATSGATLELCTKALKARGAVLALAWLYEGVSGNGST